MSASNVRAIYTATGEDVQHAVNITSSRCVFLCNFQITILFMKQQSDI